MKDEGPFILEWIAYYLSIGFTHFIINSNDCSDGTDKILNRLQEMGLVAHIDNPEPWPRGPQASAYSNAKTHPWYKEAEWIFVCDADEFLDIKVGDGTLDALFAEAPKANVFSFVWLLFGHGGVERFEDKFVIEQFCFSANPRQVMPEQCRAFKTLYRNNGIFKVIDTHRPRAPYPRRLKEIRWVDADGLDMGSKYSYFGWNFSNDGVGYGEKFGRLNHYAIRSVESYLVKRLRGDVNTTTVHSKNDGTGSNYLKLHCWNSVESTSIHYKTPTVRKIYEKLLGDSKLNELHKNTCDNHWKRIFELRNDPEVVALIKEFTEFNADTKETGLEDCAVASNEVTQSKMKFLSFSPVKKINNIRKIQDEHIVVAQNLPSNLMVDASTGTKSSNNEIFGKINLIVTSSSEDPIKSKAQQKANTKYTFSRSARNQQIRSAFSGLGKPKKVLLIGMQDPDRIAELLEIADAKWMGVMASWGSHLVNHRNWANTDYYLARNKIFDYDQKFVNILSRFNKDISDHRLSFYRAQPHMCLRLFDPESIDIVYFHGKYRKGPLLISLDDALSKLRPGGHIILDAYNKLKPNSTQQKPMLSTIHQFLSEHPSELRIAEVTGTFLRIQKLPPL